jgi:hypothetical protein
MADNKRGKTRIIDVNPGDEPHALDAMEQLQAQMAEQAGEAARDAAQRFAQAIGAGVMAQGLKVAYPLKELAELVGEVLGESLEGIRIRPGTQEDDE